MQVCSADRDPLELAEIDALTDLTEEAGTEFCWRLSTLTPVLQEQRKRPPHGRSRG